MLTLKATLLVGWNVLVSLVQGWPYKILLAPPVIFYREVLGGDAHIVLVFYAVFFLDLFIGLASAIKRRVFSRKKLDLWVVKLLVHTLCILLIGLLDLALIHALRGLHLPLLDIVVSIMLVGEVASIFENLHELTGRVPPFLMSATDKLRRKANQRLEAILDVGDDKPEGEK